MRAGWRAYTWLRLRWIVDRRIGRAMVRSGRLEPTSAARAGRCRLLTTGGSHVTRRSALRYRPGLTGRAAAPRDWLLAVAGRLRCRPTRHRRPSARRTEARRGAGE